MMFIYFPLLIFCSNFDSTICWFVLLNGSQLSYKFIEGRKDVWDLFIIWSALYTMLWTSKHSTPITERYPGCHGNGKEKCHQHLSAGCNSSCKGSCSLCGPYSLALVRCSHYILQWFSKWNAWRNTIPALSGNQLEIQILRPYPNLLDQKPVFSQTLQVILMHTESWEHWPKTMPCFSFLVTRGPD